MKLRTLSLIIAASVLTGACDSTDPGDGIIRRPDVTIALSPESAVVTVGQTVQMHVSITNDTTGALSGVTWSTSDGGVASVSAGGLVTGVAAGAARIIATSRFQTNHADTAIITVVPFVGDGLVTVSLTPSLATMSVGQTLHFVAVATGGTPSQGVTFTTSNAGVVTIDSLGDARAVGGGTAKITARSVQDPSKFAEATVTVTAETGGTSAGFVTVTPSSAVLVPGDTLRVKATVSADTVGALSGVTWRSTATNVAPVTADGLVLGLTPGTAMIIATSKFKPAFADTAIITVTTAGQDVSVAVSPRQVTILAGTTYTLTATVAHDTVGSQSGVSWRSTAPSVVAVDPNGVITAIGVGTASVIATSKWRPTRADTARVTTVSYASALNLPVLGIGAVPERYTAEIAVHGNYAYTTTWGTRGFNGVTSPGNVVKIWNVTNPSQPILVDSLRIASANTTSDIQVSPDGSLLVVSTEQGQGSIVIYSLANPAAPALISRYSSQQTLRGVHTVKLSSINNRLYAFLQIDPGAGGPAQEVIVDMTNPANVQQVFVQVMGNPYVHDVFVRDGLLFTALWHDGMSIYDVGGGGRGGSPANPVLISNVKTRSGYIHNIWWYQDAAGGPNAKRYVFLGEEGPTTGPIGAGGTTSGDIHVVDISNINAPKEVAVYTLGSTYGTHNFSVDEPSGILYAAYYNGGVRAIDVRGDLGTCSTSQRAPYTSVTGAPLCDLRLMGREAGTAITTGGYFTWGVMVQGNRVFASDMAKGLVVLDITALKR